MEMILLLALFGFEEETFVEMVARRTDSVCEMRTDGTISCWPGAVIRREDGVHGSILSIDPIAECIRIVYEDGETSCSFPEGEFEVLQSQIIARRINGVAE